LNRPAAGRFRGKGEGTSLFNANLIGAAAGRRPSVAVALLGNLIPAVCVLLFGWSVFALMILYWLENLVVGVFNLFRMLVEGATRGPQGILAAVLACPFFTFHYGLFCTVHGVFVWTTFSTAEAVAPLEGLSPAELLSRSFGYVRADQELWLNFLALVGVHLVQFVDWLWRGRWSEADPLEQMVRPYGRIVALHLTILGGAVPVLLLGQPAFAVCLLAVIKTAIEVVSARRPPKAAAKSSGGAAPAAARPDPS
jgi:hypothetical protein